ncbi:interferon-inducible double-stranded RNA-dependent protein kinase activator A [Musca vetustissima]|uniref:interferon-inducible double-stranded RNA-dependent protein kinase activator A n=1 Tax=Musca vetustissima TaxID=27455 RepID=UPI002AB6AEF9|nr:interferon-inducible double-stranded RNA-dependent protein kinase activator A [Musca vetustissima]
MASKSSVSALQEYCAKHKIPPPTYDCIDAEDGTSFICRAQVMNMEADGQGRSKRDAKHAAASNLIKRLRVEYPDIDNIRPVEVVPVPPTDMIVKLRDYCVQHQHPLPVFEIVQQGGPPDAPEFIALCSVASIRRYGVSDKKKDAKQIAATKIFDIIFNVSEEYFRTTTDIAPMEHEMQVAPIDTKIEDIEAERYQKFKTYRELTESGIDDPPGILLCDRHNYFAKFHNHLKMTAKEILLSEAYDEDYESQAKELLHALKISPRIKQVSAEKTIEPIVQIELDCEYDVLFANTAEYVYKNVLDYFRDMLDY